MKLQFKKSKQSNISNFTWHSNIFLFVVPAQGQVGRLFCKEPDNKCFRLRGLVGSFTATRLS